MWPHGKPISHHRHGDPRQSDDYVPLLPVRRNSRTHNAWNDDEDDKNTSSEISGLLHRNLDDSTNGLPEDETDPRPRIRANALSLNAISKDLDDAKTNDYDLFDRTSSPNRARESSPTLRLSSSFQTDEDREEIDSEEELKLVEDDSRYEEVRAAVSNTDDSAMPCVR